MLRSPLVSSGSDAASTTLSPAEVLLPLAEFTDKSSLLLVAGSAVAFFELQSSVPEKTKNHLYNPSELLICRNTVS